MPTLQARCERCSHSYSFHGKGQTHCKATGCKKGDDGKRCEGFVPEPALSPTA